jgi:beta-phosphoglucomutase-like phosphatase (HAD superfamily)
VKPGFCRAYEDTDLGLQAIRAAGMQAVDVRQLIGVPE